MKYFTSLILLWVVLFGNLTSSYSQTYLISTIAGNPKFGFAGDDGKAIKAQLDNPYSVAEDDSGNIYVSNYYTGRVRMINKHDTIVTFAGGGTAGVNTVGPATAASIYTPSGITFDKSGNLYIADADHNSVRKVTKAGIISLVAGDSLLGFSGDGGPATSAEIFGPTDVAADKNGNIYIVDEGNSRIRKVTPAGIISTFAGNGTAGYSGDGGQATAAEFFEPSSVAADTAGNIYIADEYNNRIRKVNAAGIITTFAGQANSGYSGDGGPATAAELATPVNVRCDTKGNLFMADESGWIIRKVNSAGIITTVAGQLVDGFSGDGGPATSAEINYANGVFVDKTGNILIADTKNCRVRKVNTGDTITTIAGCGAETTFWGDSARADSAEIYHPTGVAIDRKGNIYISDDGNLRIRKINTGDTITTIAGDGTPNSTGNGGPSINAEINGVSQIIVDTMGNTYFPDIYGAEIRVINSSGIINDFAGNGQGGYSGDGGPAVIAEIYQPFGLAVGNSGNIYLADTWNQYIRRINSGFIYYVAGDGLPGYGGDGRPATAGSVFNYPSSLATDKNGNLYIADQQNNCIRVIKPDDYVYTVAGSPAGGFSGDGGPAAAAMLLNPQGVATDTAGNIYISDHDNYRVRKIDKKTGIINTIAGSGNRPFVYKNGDGGLATKAYIYYPVNLTVDGHNNVYVADYYNNSIRKLTYYAVAFSASDSTLCAGTVVNFTDLSVDNPTGWNWTFPGGIPATSTAQNPSVSYNTPGVYPVKLQVSTINGPDSVTVPAFINVLPPCVTAVKQLTESPKVYVYPNPANKYVTIVLQNYQGIKANILIYNVLGENVIDGTLNSGNNKLNIQTLSPGLYLYRITSDEGSTLSTGKLSVQ